MLRHDDVSVAYTLLQSNISVQMLIILPWSLALIFIDPRSMINWVLIWLSNLWLSATTRPDIFSWPTLWIMLSLAPNGHISIRCTVVQCCSYNESDSRWIHFQLSFNFVVHILNMSISSWSQGKLPILTTMKPSVCIKSQLNPWTWKLL